MRDYKARPGPQGRKPARRPRSHPFRRSREPLPKGFRPLARPEPPRRQGPSRVASAVRSVRAWPLGSLLLGAALLWLVAGLVSGAVALWQAPLREVALSGNQAVPADAVLQLAGLSAGLSLAEIDPFETARRIATHPRVTSADVRRLYPGRVAIRLQERQPELRVRLADGRTALVDRQDIVLSILPAGHAATAEQRALPLLSVGTRAAELSAPLREPGIARARTALRVLHDLNLAEPESAVVDAADPFALTLLLPRGRRLIVRPADMEAQLRVYRDTFERYPLAFETGGAVDLTTLDPDGSGRIVLRRR